MLEKIGDLCNGCQACVNICPRNALVAASDDEGFLRPLVDSAKCVGCGLCEAVCPIANDKTSRNDAPSPIAFGAVNRDAETRENSSSGGLFYLLASVVVKRGGVVFGAKFDDDFRVVHGCAETLEGIAAFQGSKYVQSDVGTAFRQAKKFLEQGRPVLFTGTPCQIGGLKAFLKKDYDNLYCQDIICYGTPSPKAWKKYVAFREAKAKSKARFASFRHKRISWRKYSTSIEFTNGATFAQDLGADFFMQAFLQKLTLRKSCYSCAYKTLARQADITLADFWGVEKVAPELDDDRGTSLVLVHSAKGRELFDAVRDEIVCREVDVNQAVAYNSAATKSVPTPRRRDDFLKEIAVRPFDKTVKKYCKTSKIFALKRRVRRLLAFLIGRRRKK